MQDNKQVKKFGSENFTGWLKRESASGRKQV